MDLKEYLDETGIPKTVIAKKSGISSSYLIQILNGISHPSKDVVKRIAKSTRGEVSEEEIEKLYIVRERKQGRK